MPTMAEARTAPGQLAGALKAGVDSISSTDSVQFAKYYRVVSPLDGTTWWVRASNLSPGAVANVMLANAVPPNEASRIAALAPLFSAGGSLHYATDLQQGEAANSTTNRMIFTAKEEVRALNEYNPAMIYIGTRDGVQFAFSRRGSFYRQADLYHYVGDAVYSDMQTQVVEDPSEIDVRSVVVSNSLPAWLLINSRPSYPWEAAPKPNFRIYPSFLSPTNAIPPYATIHVSDTTNIASAPTISSDASHLQLSRDRVRITLWGLDNGPAQDFVDYVFGYMTNDALLGLMNVPAISDEKRNQVELTTLAKKKIVEFEVSYYQSRMRNVARQLLEDVVAQYLVQ